MLPFTLESDQVRDGFPCNGNPVAGVPAQVSRGWEVACDLHSAPAQNCVQEVLINSGQSLQTNSIAPEPNQNSSQNLPRPQLQQCRLGFWRLSKAIEAKCCEASPQRFLLGGIRESGDYKAGPIAE